MAPESTVLDQIINIKLLTSIKPQNNLFLKVFRMDMGQKTKTENQFPFTIMITNNLKRQFYDKYHFLMIKKK